MPMPMRFSIATLGCKVNQYESERIREALYACGYSEQRFGSPVDLALINTCTVTHRSDAEGRTLIRKAMGKGRVIVTGCQAVTAPDALRAFVDKVEVIAPSRLADALHTDLPRWIQGFAGHTRAFVKVQEGCNNFCSYCIVPLARGLPVSRPVAEILTEINTLCQAGYREIVLTGINLGLYEGGISALLRKILDATPVHRIRISSLEPWTLDDSFFHMLRSERICPHVHLPLQSGSPKILAAMGRPYSADYYRTLVHELRAAYPHLAIGTDIMVGFPGEDDVSFDESFRFLATLPLTDLHLFSYSRRPGTRAAAFPGQVEESTKKNRIVRLRRLSAEKRAAFIASQQGSFQEVLVTGAGDARLIGLTANYIRIRVPGTAVKGDIFPARIDASSSLGMGGQGNG